MITNEDLKDQAVANTLDWLIADFNLNNCDILSSNDHYFKTN